jgi:predicted O-linked N-acetylglucosamine transferase (SPINDLY family)
MVIKQVLQSAWQFHQQGQAAQAESMCRQVLREHPQHTDALYLLGLVLSENGKLREALEFMQRAIASGSARKEDLARAYNNVATILFTLGRHAEALEAVGNALARAPDMADAHHNMGKILCALGRLEEAIAAHRQAVALRPNFPEGFNDLGIACQASGRVDDAVAAYKQAILLQPNSGGALCNLGNVLKEMGQLEQAIQTYRQAVSARPDLPDPHSNLVFAMNYSIHQDPVALREELGRWNLRHEEPLAGFRQPFMNDRSPDRRLRVGYVSPNFRDHCQAFFMVPLLRNHDREQFEVFCFSDVGRSDHITDQLRVSADVWRDTSALSHQQVVEQIRQDKIDVLVDLTMHMSNNRLQVFARKPAPVQICWLAYPGSTGITGMDYRLTDPFLDPPGNEQFYSEESLQLPDSFWCYDPLTDEPTVNDLPAKRSGHVTFGCFNNFFKINDPLLRLWAQILTRVPKSRLILLSPQGSHRERTLEVFRRNGVEPERVEFVRHQKRAKYLELYHRIDIALDSYPCNGHTTSLDALWMGVVVITLVGSTAISRAGWCQLSNLKLTEHAAHTSEQYVEIGSALASDLDRLAALRSTLRQRISSSPLMDQSRFARSIEAAYRDAWRRWCVR